MGWDDDDSDDARSWGSASDEEMLQPEDEEEIQEESGAMSPADEVFSMMMKIQDDEVYNAQLSATPEQVDRSLCEKYCKELGAVMAKFDEYKVLLSLRCPAHGWCGCGAGAH